MAYVIAALVCVLILFYKWTTRTYNHWSSLNVAGPKPVPFFGHVLKVVLGKEYLPSTFADIYMQYPKDKYVGIYRFMTPVLLLRDPAIIKNILIKDFEVFEDRGVEYGKKGSGVNLFHSDGDTWSVLRKNLTPIFTSAKIKGMFKLVNERGERFVNLVDELSSSSEELELHKLSSRFTAEAISACAFGLDIDAINTKPNYILEMGYKLFVPSWRMFLDLVFPGSLKKLDMDFFNPELTQHFEDFVKNIVKEREGQPKVRRDFMDLMIEMKEEGQLTMNKIKSSEIVDLEMTDSIMAAQALIFFGAGFETSSTTITLMMYELALQQDIQNKVSEEIKATLDKYDGNLTYEAITEMKYLDNVMLETLRKYPVIDLIRRSTRTYTIPGTNLTIPKGTHVTVPQIGINYDPQYFPEPERFDPDRFSQDKGYNWLAMPFGAGPRECIGNRFAKLTVKVCIAHFLNRLRVVPCNRTQDKIDYVVNSLVISPKGGVWLKVQRR